MQVYQTWKTHYLPYHFSAYHESWKKYHNVVFSNDTLVLQDIRHFCETNFVNLCNFLNEYSVIKKIDIWRYIIIWKNGGIYADIDIGIRKGEYFSTLCQRYDLVVFKESPTIHVEPFKWLIHTIKYITGINDFARWNQYRQSVFCARKYHPFFYELLTHIDNQIEGYSEPRLTYELTGPGIFTDIIQGILHDNNTHVVYYNEGLSILDYHHAGTWKPSNNDANVMRIISVVIMWSSSLLILTLIKVSSSCRHHHF